MADLRSRFLPISFVDLLAALTLEYEPAQRPRFAEMVAEMRRIIANEAHTLQGRLDELYEPFDRDSEVVHGPPPPRPGRHRPKHPRPEAAEAWAAYDRYHRRRQDTLDRLARCIEYLFEKANFDELPPERIDRLLEMTRQYGLRMRVRPERFQIARVFGRGRHVKQKQKRRLRRLGRTETYDAPAYSRLATMVKAPDQRFLQIYLYRDIDGDEFAPLLPGGTVRVGWLDRLMILAAGAGAIGMVLRLIGQAQNWLQRTGGAEVQRQPWWPILLMGGAVALVAAKAWTSYRRSKQKYLRIITKSLFDSSLDNNAGALAYLVRLMAKEESQEGLIAYVVAARRLGGRCTRRELDAAVERWLDERFAVRGANFQIGDAVETMARLGMLAEDGPTLAIRPLKPVAEHLTAVRRDRSTGEYHLEAIEAHHRRIARIEAGQCWTCPALGADGQVCGHVNALQEAYCDLCGGPREAAPAAASDA